MNSNDSLYKAYVSILKEELIPAMGCTEPIALAYAASIARKTLGINPDRVRIQASGSIIKNVKSVIVPNTHHLKGMSAAVASGIIAGNPDKKLEVISEVCEEKKCEIETYLKQTQFSEEFLEDGHVFDLIITLYAGNEESRVRITDTHTNVVLIEKNRLALFEKKLEVNNAPVKTDRTLLNMESIYEFAECVAIEDVKEILERQISYNVAISEEGLRNDYGANIGKVIMHHQDPSVRTRAKARAAAASDARMNGCELPVVINSGSGNQGITCSLPVIEYAQTYHVKKEKLYRALIISNLTAIHEKTGIGTLSAFCGAVSAGAGAGAGIAYLMGADFDGISHTVVNALAISSGIVCDGAKASCAAKIAAGVDAGIFGYEMYCDHQQFYGGDGIVVKGIENTIHNIGRLGNDGMKETNNEIIRMMIEK